MIKVRELTVEQINAALQALENEIRELLKRVKDLEERVH